MSDSASASDTLAAAQSLLAEALAHLEASDVIVELHPKNGMWLYVIDGRPGSEGKVIAMAARIAPVGSRMVQ